MLVLTTSLNFELCLFEQSFSETDAKKMASSLAVSI